MLAISVRNTIMRKFANFVRLYFPHITTFFNQILGFYYFLKVLLGNVVFLVGICLEQKLVYKENCLLIETHDVGYKIAACLPPYYVITYAWLSWLASFAGVIEGLLTYKLR